MCTIKLYNINKHKIQPDYFGSSLKSKYSKGNGMRKKIIFFRCNFFKAVQKCIGTLYKCNSYVISIYVT